MQCLRRGVLILIPSILMVTLTGCPPTPIQLKTIKLSPIVTHASYYYKYSESWECDVPLLGEGLFVNGLGQEPIKLGEVTVGWEDIYNEGSPPFPCEETQQMLYRGQVQFDLSQFNAVSGATLTYDVSHAENKTAGSSETPPTSYATVLGMSTGTRNDGNGPYFWDYDNEASISTCGFLISPNCSVDVSRQVNQWTSQQHFNWGFILAGPKLSIDDPLPQDHNAQLTWYNNFKLTVMYNPALNPRTPH